MPENGEKNGSGLLRWVVGLLVGVLLALIGNLVAGVQWGSTLSADFRNLSTTVQGIATEQKTQDLKIQRLDKDFAVFRATSQKGGGHISDNP